MSIFGICWGILAAVNLYYHFIRGIMTACDGGDSVSTGYRQNDMETVVKSLTLNRDTQN